MNFRQGTSILLSALLAPGFLWMQGCRQDEKKAAAPGAVNQAAAQAPATTYARPTADQLYQLVAPIALFPDNLVAQVLAGSTYPDQVAAAQTWLQQNSSLKGDALTQAVNAQPWDVSIKGLTQFPDVLSQMASNLSWTSALGDAYFNIPQDVMNAIQVMRGRASDAGNLKSNQQQTVTVQPASAQAAQPPAQGSNAPQTTVVQAPPQTIVIQPAQPQVVYVPAYNPTVVYGAPVAVYPGYVPPPPPSTGALVATGLISFGLGMAVGAAMNNNCCGWGWNSWGCGWHSSTVVYNRNVYVSNSTTFVSRNAYYNNHGYAGYNRNNVNVNNVNINNVNRNNINNVNRNNFNQNNRNDYRANNFNNANRGSSYTTPNFGTAHNQTQYRNENLARPQQQVGQNNLAANRPNVGNFDNANRPGSANRSGNRPDLGQQQARPSGTQNFNRPEAPPQRPQATPNANRPNAGAPQTPRGYGGAEPRTNSTAFSNYQQGGNARVNSARGQQSMSGQRFGGDRSSGGAARRGHRQ